MEVVDYRVTEGSDYTWHCFGIDANPYSLSAWNNDYKGWSFNIVFDTKTQEVYIVEACDYKHNRAYRLFNPAWKDAYFKYAENHNSEYRDMAWDDVDFVDLETDEDWLAKAYAIVEGEDYDTRVQVPVDFSDEELFKYMKMAHERDITLNQLIEEALKSAIEDYDRDPEGAKARAQKWKKDYYDAA